MARCPFCAEDVRGDEIICPHCESQLHPPSVEGKPTVDADISGPPTKLEGTTGAAVANNTPKRWKKPLLVVLTVVALLALLVPLLIFQILPAAGYRAISSAGSFCDFATHCYGETAGFPSGALDCEETAKYLISDSNNPKAVYPAEVANKWMECALLCQGTCEEVDNCVSKCPAETLHEAYKWSCAHFGDEITKTEGMNRMLYGDGQATAKSGLELFAEVVRCERRQLGRDLNRSRNSHSVELLHERTKMMQDMLRVDEDKEFESKNAGQYKLQERVINRNGIYKGMGLRHSDIYRSIIEGYTDPAIELYDYSGETVRNAITSLSWEKQDLWYGGMIWELEMFNFKSSRIAEALARAAEVGEE